MIRSIFVAGLGAFAALALTVCTDASTPAAASTPVAVAQAVLPLNPKSVEPMPSLAPLVKQLRPAVVNIYTTQNVRARRSPRGQGSQEELFDWFFRGPGQPQQRGGLKSQALGSGFLIGDGLALTNNHVVEQADEIKVKLADGREFDAKVAGRDPSTDVALIELQGEGARALAGVALGDSDAIEVGDYVVAIGNPFGLSHTVTSGIVSAKERVIGAGPYDDFIQTDASINPGNSGGPLFNLRGEVVGINTAIVAHGQGIGFAVPVNLVKELLPQLRESGHVARGWLGVGIQEVSPELARTFDVKPGSGVLIAQVFEDGPAARAGVESGDVVLSFNGRQVDSPAALSRAVASVSPGESVKLKLVRDGRQRTLEVKLEQREDSLAALDGRGRSAPAPQAESLVGLSVTPLTPELARRHELETSAGLLVEEVRPDSAADRAGVRPGDVLLDLQRKRVQSLEDFNAAASRVKKGESVLFRVRRGGAALFLTSKA